MKGGGGFIGVQTSGLSGNELVYVFWLFLYQKHKQDWVAWTQASGAICYAQQAPG